MEQNPQQQGDQKFNRVDATISILLVVITLGLYHQVSHFEYLRVDDPQYVAQNWHVLSGLNAGSIQYAITAIVSSNWHPLTLLVEMLTVQLFGSAPGVLHNLCAGFHAANVALLFIFLRLTTRSQTKAVIVAMLWGWHPLRVESVAWVGELKDVLCGFFWLLTMLAFARYRRIPSFGTYVPVILGTVLALLSKPMAVTLPAALFLLNFWPLNKRPDERIDLRWISRRLLEQLPLLVLSIAVAVISIRTQQMTQAIGTLEDFPLSLRITSALYSYICYVGKQIMPMHMGLIYPHPAAFNRTVPAIQWISGTIFVALVTIFAVCFRRTKPYLLVNWLWFLGCLIPVIGLVQVGQASMADRYTYLPEIGTTIIVVWLVADLLVLIPIPRIVAGLIAIAATSTLFVITFAQISFWQNNVTLMEHSDQVIPEDFLAKSSLALSYASDGQVSKALDYAQTAVNLVPWNQEAHHALAMAYAADNRIPDAISEEAIAIHRDSNHPGLWIDLGHLLIKQNRLADAVKAFRKAVDLDPDLPDARNDLAATLAILGDLDGAIAQWQIVIHQSPGFAQAQGLLADALLLKNDPNAVQHYQAAILAGSKNPDWETKLTWLVATSPQASIADIKPMVALAKDACDQTHSKKVESLDAYAACLARVGRFDDAIATAQQALAQANADQAPAVAEGIQKRLALYRKFLPYLAGDHVATTSPG